MTPPVTPERGLAANPEVVDLSIPALPELLSLPRLTAAAVAARVGFDIDEVEDLRLAIEELCLAAFDGRGPGRLRLRMVFGTGAFEVDCTFQPEDGEAPIADARSELATGITEQLLEALVDEHGTEIELGVARTWFRKAHPGIRVE